MPDPSCSQPGLTMENPPSAPISSHRSFNDYPTKHQCLPHPVIDNTNILGPGSSESLADMLFSFLQLLNRPEYQRLKQILVNDHQNSLFSDHTVTDTITNNSSGAFVLDHACWRVQTKEEYLETKKRLLDNDSNCGQNQLLIEAMINGRPISAIKLSHPIQWRFYKLKFDCLTGKLKEEQGCLNIPVIELPCPKPGGRT